MKNYKGFTLIEILIVLGILAILASIVIIAINPGQHFKDARQAKRQANVNTIMNAINQNMISNKGTFTCSATVPADSAEIASGAGNVDLCSCLVPTYVGTMPVETDKTAFTGCPSSYSTGYYIRLDGTRYTVSSTGELVNDNSDDVYITR